MHIDFRNMTKGGNNIHCRIFINGIIASENFNTSPKEFEELVKILNAGAEALGSEGVTVSQT